MERVQDFEPTPEVFENQIALYLHEFCQAEKIEDMTSESQGRWYAALMYIKRHVFNDKSILKRSVPLDGYINNNYNDQRSNLNLNNCNAYDIDKVNAICDYYIYMCYRYTKGITITGFCKLTGINEDTIYDWGAEGSRKLSKSSFEIYKKLHSEYEASAEAKLWGNKNPVAVMAILNKRFGWNLPGVTREKSERHVLTVDELPKLGNKLCENQTQLPNSGGENQ